MGREGAGVLDRRSCRADHPHESEGHSVWRQHRIEARLRVCQYRIKVRLHRLAQPAEIRCLLRHDRIDAHLLRRREVEFAGESLAHSFAPPRAKPAPAVGRPEGRTYPSPALAPAMECQAIGSEAETDAGERDDDQ